MIILNKACVLWFPHPSFLLICQNLGTILILSVMGKNECLWEIRLLKQWIPCSLLFCMNLFSSLQSLVYVSVPTFTVLRNLQPILSVGIDFIVRGEKHTFVRIIFLVQILIGAILYCSHDLEFEPRGYFWAILHCFSMTFYSVLVKFKSDALGLSASSMSWFNNIMSIPGLLTIMVFENTLELGSQADYTGRTFDDCMRCANSPWCTVIILLSCAGGFCVSVTGFQAQQVMSPTSWLSLNNFSKIPAILISFILFGGFISPATVHGMIISITAAYFYALSARQSLTVFSHLVAFSLTSSSIFWVFSDSSFVYAMLQSPVFFAIAVLRNKTVLTTEGNRYMNRTTQSRGPIWPSATSIQGFLPELRRFQGGAGVQDEGECWMG
jgi:drug/metabolite transporter (DMT)-like permease